MSRSSKEEVASIQTAIEIEEHDANNPVVLALLDTNQQATVNEAAHTSTDITIQQNISTVVTDEPAAESASKYRHKRAASDRECQSPLRLDSGHSSEASCSLRRLQTEVPDGYEVNLNDEEEIPSESPAPVLRTPPLSTSTRTFTHTPSCTRAPRASEARLTPRFDVRTPSRPANSIPSAPIDNNPTPKAASEKRSLPERPKPETPSVASLHKHVPRGTKLVLGTAAQRKTPTSFPADNPFPPITRIDEKGNKYLYVFQNRNDWSGKQDPTLVNKYKRWYRQVWGRQDPPLNPGRPRRTQAEFDDWVERLTNEGQRMAHEAPSRKSRRSLNWQSMVDEHNAKFAGTVFTRGTLYSHTDESEAKQRTMPTHSTKDEVFQARLVNATKTWVAKCAPLKRLRDILMYEKQEYGSSSDEAEDEEDQDEEDDEAHDSDQSMDYDRESFLSRYDRDFSLPVEEYNPTLERAAENGFGGIYEGILVQHFTVRSFRVPKIRGERSRKSMGRNLYGIRREKQLYRVLKARGGRSWRSSVHSLLREHEEKWEIEKTDVYGPRRGKRNIAEVEEAIMQLEANPKIRDLDDHPSPKSAITEIDEEGLCGDQDSPYVPIAFELEPRVEDPLEFTIHNLIEKLRSSRPIWTNQAERQANIAYAMATAGLDFELDITPVLNILTNHLNAANTEGKGTDVVGGAINTVRQHRFLAQVAAKRLGE